MSFNFLELDNKVRTFMNEELLDDIPQNRLHLADRLNEEGRRTWANLLSEAIMDYDEVWLAEKIVENNILNETEPYKRSASGLRKINRSSAAKLLAEGEFNKYYIRGICQKAIEEERGYIFVYRAKEVKSPRTESEKLVNNQINPSTLLEICRGKTNHELYWLLLEPNSGLSIRSSEEIS